MTVLSKVCFRRIEIQACPPTPRLRALSAIRDFASWQGARCRRLCARRFAGSARCLLGEKEKRKKKNRREEKSQR